MDDLPPLPDGSRNANPEGLGFWQLVREDFATNGNNLGSQGFWALFWHRFGNWRMGLPSAIRPPFTVIYRIMFKATEIFCGIHLPYAVPVGRRVALDHFGGMILVARAIGDDVTIRQNTTFGISRKDALRAKPIIGNRVDIGAGAVIIGNVHVGDDAVIGANAVVTADVPPNCLALGVPAKVKERKPC
jgi:serine O-acetyltransferase